jgi:hypothetical protein
MPLGAIISSIAAVVPGIISAGTNIFNSVGGGKPNPSVAAALAISQAANIAAGLPSNYNPKTGANSTPAESIVTKLTTGNTPLIILGVGGLVLTYFLTRTKKRRR